MQSLLWRLPSPQMHNNIEWMRIQSAPTKYTHHIKCADLQECSTCADFSHICQTIWRRDKWGMDFFSSTFFVADFLGLSEQHDTESIFNETNVESKVEKTRHWSSGAHSEFTNGCILSANKKLCAITILVMQTKHKRKFVLFLLVVSLFTDFYSLCELAWNVSAWLVSN